jgi:thiamine phosphate synthase YjbQ (UPF0047 family)
MIKTQKLRVKTKGDCDIVNITEETTEAVAQSGILSGTVTLFNIGLTG